MVNILKSKKQVVWAVHVAALFVCWGAEPVMSRFFMLFVYTEATTTNI